MSRAHEMAADWLQRLDSPALEERELHQWLEWFGASDEHREAFEEMQSLRDGLRRVADPYHVDVRRRLGLDAPRSGRNEAGRWLVPLAAMLALTAILFGVWRWQWLASPAAPAVYTAPAAGPGTQVLKDGSLLVMGAGAQVAVTYSPARRVLEVRRGMAYFDVHADPGRPFVVRAGTVEITALGTAFSVARKASQVAVVVTEGVVSVSGGVDVQGNDLVEAGQRTVLPLDPRSVGRVAMDRPGADASGERADFVDAPLPEVLRFVNRYAARELSIEDPRVTAFTYSGTILREHLDEWVASLPRVYPIRVVPMDDGGLALVTGER